MVSNKSLCGASDENADVICVSCGFDSRPFGVSRTRIGILRIAMDVSKLPGPKNNGEGSGCLRSFEHRLPLPSLKSGGTLETGWRLDPYFFVTPPVIGDRGILPPPRSRWKCIRAFEGALERGSLRDVLWYARLCSSVLLPASTIICGRQPSTHKYPTSPMVAVGLIAYTSNRLTRVYLLSN